MTQTLRLGDRGADVIALQQRLAELHFSPGAIDGDFGHGTEAAVVAFQRGAGLLDDGVAGPRTLAALGLADSAELPSAIPGVTVQVVCRVFPDAPVDNIKAHLPRVCDALVERSLADKPMVLMALATIRAETAGFAPIGEYLSRWNTSPGGQPYDLYDFRKDLGNGAVGDGARYKGRGFIQLTGKANYAQHGAAIGLGSQLVTEPELANDPVIAARLLASFLGAKERAIKQALVAGDLATARRLVNGGSHGLEAFSAAYRTGEQLIPAG